MTDQRSIDHLDDNEMAAFIDGALTGPARAQVESHLANCPSCRSMLAIYLRAASKMAPAFQPVAPPYQVPSRLFALILNVRPLWALPLAAGLIVAIIAAVLLLSVTEPPPPSQVTSAPSSTSPATDQPSSRPTESPEAQVPSSKTSTPEIKTKPKPRRTPEIREPDETLLARRGGRKIIDNKTFRFRGGIWIDTEYEAARELPLIEAKRDSPAYRELLAQHPTLARYAEVGQNVIIVLQGKAYKLTL
ncbi:MAG: zf-HC2 domain-containing protein [Acidobacteria bacterium]|nr:zf-HC2 domain-containing protein [Acidobacteriota bacterium]